MRSRFLLSLLLCAAARPALAVDDPEATLGNTKPGEKGEPPLVAMKKFSVAPGLRVDLWAAEPLLANPVALSFDHRGRAFIAETYRRRTSAPDIRKNMDWLLPDLALRTVEDREALLKKLIAPEAHLKPNAAHQDLNHDGQFDWRDWEIESERIKLVEDRAGKGVADSSSVFAEGFSTLLTGTAAGVLVYGDNVWYTAIPDLWRLDGASGNSASSRTKLLTGFGVHVAYGGHDMHGIKMGPDGRIYWTIADTGAHVRTKEGTVIDNPDSGAVFRCHPDGTELELYATGLRNPQSLAFNDVGDLFTGDNNADGGDKARWEHLVEGADYGWRIGWQFLPKLGAWNAERLWEMDLGQTALSLLPPTGLLGHGPAGVAYYPGTGLPESYRGHFLMADFPGGVRAFDLKPNGASYLVNLAPNVQLDNTPSKLEGKLLWGLYPSDVQFGVEGGAYVLDWVRGWDKTGQGRIYRVHDPATDASAAVARTKQLLAEGMAQRPDAELIALLAEPDQRVRMAAQFALAAKGEAALPALTATANAGPLLPRLHAIWALGQIGRQQPRAFAPLAALVTDRAPEVRAQAAKVLGESGRPAYADQLVLLLEDPEPRVRFFAALSLGRLHPGGAVQPLVSLLRRGVGGDAYLRHAAARALSECAQTAELTALAYDPSDTVRAGILLALRRQHSPEVATFLKDPSPQLELEAARAIHDEPIPEAIPLLASWAGQPNLPSALSRRAINAAYRVGTAQAASWLATLAANAKAPAPARADALDALTQWNVDLGRDRVLGIYRPLPPTRVAPAAATAVEPLLTSLLKDPLEAIRLAAAGAAGQLGIKAAAPELLAVVEDEMASSPVRSAALRALSLLKSEKLGDAIAAALRTKDGTLRREAQRLAAKLSPDDALRQAAAVLDSRVPGEMQGAFQTLATLPDTGADTLLAKWLDRLLAGKVPPAAQLELLEAAAARKAEAVQKKLAAYEAARSPADPLGRWLECLEGGDAKLGRQAFAEKAEAACMRCHKYSGEGGDVGPDLAGIGARHDRKYILTSIVLPNADIAPGYENVLLTLNDGNMIVGIKSAETDDLITIQPLTGGEKVKVKKTEVKQRDKAPSPMPEGLGEVLGKRDLRNVVEFLSTSK